MCCPVSFCQLPSTHRSQDNPFDNFRKLQEVGTQWGTSVAECGVHTSTAKPVYTEKSLRDRLLTWGTMHVDHKHK